MTQHLKFCKQRIASFKTSGPDGSQKTRLFHLLVEGTYLPMYWMHLEVPADATLADIDGFLRDTWLECCGHLSAFEIGGTSYADEPGDFSFQIVGAEVQEEGEKEEPKEVEDEGEEEYEDLSPEELGVAVGKVLDAVPLEWRKNLPDELQVELRRPRSRDELVAFLKEKLNAMPKGFSLFIFENLEEQRGLYFQQNILKLLLDMVEDRSLGVPLEKVLKVGQQFSYTYDFGSSTDLSLRVQAEREGVVTEDEDLIEVMARNEPPDIVCGVCGKPATKVINGYTFLCDACTKNRKRGEYGDMILPVVNSPRVGVCGYTGDSDYAWEEDEYDEEEYEEDEEDEETE